MLQGAAPTAGNAGASTSRKAGSAAAAAPAAAAAVQASWLAANADVTSEQMGKLMELLEGNGLSVEDTSPDNNNCCIHAILTQIYGQSCDGDSVQSFRVLIADRLELKIVEEGGSQGPISLSIAAQAGLDESATDAEVQRAVQQHMLGLRGTAMLTDVDIAALAAVVQELHCNISIEVFNPTYTSPSLSWCYTDNQEDPFVVRIAYVWSEWLEAYLAGGPVPEGSGPLNHFVVVQVQEGFLGGDGGGNGKRPLAQEGNGHAEQGRANKVRRVG